MASKKVQASTVTPIRVEVGRALQALLTLQQARFDGPVMDRYRVARLITRLENAEKIQSVDRVRRELVEKYGKRDPVTGSTTVTNWSAFNEEYGRITQEIIELEEIKPLPFAFLDQFYFLVSAPQEKPEEPKRAPLQPNDIKVLAPFFEEPELEN